MKYLFILLVIGCGYRTKPQYKSKAIDKDTGRYAKFPYIATESNIQKLVSRVDSSDCVYFGRIGYTGEESEVYDSYQRLLEIAPDSIWVQLSYNNNPIIRIYAFKALQTKNRAFLKEVEYRLQKDKATFCYVSADTRTIYSVSSFVSH